MVNDDHIREACELLDRLIEIQFQRRHPNEEMPEDMHHWHTLDNVLSALSVLDSYRTQATLQDQVNVVKQLQAAGEQRWREMMGKKLDG